MVCKAKVSSNCDIKVNNDNEAKLWHLRLGHMSFNKLNMFTGFVHKNCQESFLCTICPAAKQTRLSFSHRDIKSDTVLSLIHVDLWGPYKFVSRLGHHMFVLLMILPGSPGLI